MGVSLLAPGKPFWINPFGPFGHWRNEFRLRIEYSLSKRHADVKHQCDKNIVLYQYITIFYLIALNSVF